MKSLRTVVIAALCGALLGAGSLLLVQTWSTSSELERQKAALVVLKDQLHQQESQLALRQGELDEQAAALKGRLERASALVDQVTQVQGTSVERLKKVIDVLKTLKAELRSP